MKSVRTSTWQILALKRIQRNGSGMKAAEIMQGTFGSLVRRGWVSYSPKYGFYITEEGQEVLEPNPDSILRKNVTPHLTKYFDAEKYKLRLVKKGAA
jgi:hypothetical protein